MPKMTAKYSTALTVARREKITVNGNQEELYSQLQEIGWWWNSDRKEWEHHEPAEADDPSPFVLIRVWVNEEIAPDVADDVIKGLKPHYTLVERSEPYRCRPPKQREARVYLRFMPKAKETKR
jgi:hypothetical protein